MADLTNALQQLREERQRQAESLENITVAIAALEGLAGRNGAKTPTSNGRRPRRGMSAAGRRRIAEAQRARWARARMKVVPTPSQAKGQASRRAKRRTISAAGRRRIAAAQRRRWAKQKAQTAKKAA
jgi:hypothetical protein